MTELDAIEELKQLFRTEIGLDADENPADFSGWLFLKRQKSMMAVIEDLAARNQERPFLVKHVKSILNHLL